MGYWDIAQMARDTDLYSRIEACVAQESPQDMAFNALLICSAPGWGEAWASAVAAGNPAPGRDPAVITDGQILSAVQASLTPPAA